MTHLSDILAAGAKIAGCFGAEGAPTLATWPLGGAQLSITHVRRQYGATDPSVVLPAENAYLVVLYLIDTEHCDVWPDRPPSPRKLYPQGSICLIRLHQGAAIAINGPFEALVFHIPCAHLDELTERAGEPHVDNLAICRGVEDRTIRDIGAALMPMFARGGDAEARLLAHVGLAFNAHLAHRYGRPHYRH